MTVAYLSLIDHHKICVRCSAIGQYRVSYLKMRASKPSHQGHHTTLNLTTVQFRPQQQLNLSYCCDSDLVLIGIFEENSARGIWQPIACAVRHKGPNQKPRGVQIFIPNHCIN
mmetsp:Transcript_20249/g.41018  ORF Transcript_20249/g.41018 Transcript_20249/m.41018 type:complete len:113 (-) Transcript_20249:1133-1471(-)